MTGSAPNPYAGITDWDFYWDYLTSEGQDVGGRNVAMRVEDDMTTPSRAHDVCKGMAEGGNKAFLLLGFASPGPIQACANYANTQGIPYLSPGSSRYPLAGSSTYFSLSAPYASQAPRGMDLFASRFQASGTTKNAYLGAKGGNLPDRKVVFEAADANGVSFEVVHYSDPIARPEEMSAIVLDLYQRRIRNVWFAATPFHFVYFWKAASSYPDWRPRLMGPGMTVTVDGTLKMICADMTEAVEGSLFFSPYRAWEDKKKIQPEYLRALEAAGLEDHELHWWLWGISRAIHKMLDAPGGNLTRERFLWHVAHSKPIATGVLPKIDYEIGQHFTEDSIHLLKAKCDQDKSRWETVRASMPLSR